MKLQNTNDLQKLKNLYYQLCNNIRTIRNGEILIGEIEWNNFFIQDSIQDTIEKILDILYDMIMPIENICVKHSITRKEYLKLYCSNSDSMNIKRRRNLIESILDDKLNITKLEEIIE